MLCILKSISSQYLSTIKISNVQLVSHSALIVFSIFSYTVFLFLILDNIDLLTVYLNKVSVALVFKYDINKPISNNKYMMMI